MSKGYVYILTNPSMPGLVKIGKTCRDVSQRAHELSRSSGIPTPFEVVEAVETKDCHSLERKLHKLFAPARINIGREFFRFEAGLAASILRVTAWPEIAK